MDLVTRIRRSFSISKALGDAAMIAIGSGIALAVAGLGFAYHTDQLEKKLGKTREFKNNTNSNRN